MKSKIILLDMETQRDLFSPGGSCYRPEASKVARGIYRLIDWARKGRITVLSTLLRVRRGEIGPLADTPHCIEGTDGEKKLTRTVLASRLNLGLRNTTDLPPNLFRDHQQVIIEKRDSNILAHVRMERIITELPSSTFVLCGAGVASSILQAAVGLRNREFDVILAEDAVLGFDDPREEMALRRMEAKGVIFAPTEEIIHPTCGEIGQMLAEPRRRIHSRAG